MVGHAVAPGLGLLGGQVGHVENPCRGRLDCIADIGNHRGQHTRVERARPQDDQIGGQDGLDGLRRRHGAGGIPAQFPDARRRTHRYLTRYHSGGGVSHQIDRLDARRKHAAHDSHRVGQSIDRVDRIVRLHQQPGQQNVPGWVAFELTHLESAPDRVGQQPDRSERLKAPSQVSRSEDPQVPAQPTAGSAIVGHGDDRGYLSGPPTDRFERGGQPMPAADGDNPIRASHFSMSRWTTDAG